MPEIGNGFADLQRKLRTLGTSGAKRIVKSLGLEALAQSQACFKESRDPYGKPWAPLKSRSGKPLLKTGRGRASIALSLGSTGFRIGTNVRYMAAHQNGVDKTYKRAASSRFQPFANGRFLSKKAAGRKRQGTLYNATRFVRMNYRGGEVHLVIPQRAFLPIKGRGLGPIWGPALLRTANNVFDKIVRGGK